ncbi:MAG TPA: efflux RND transporter periplasmic adaptor subunit, partial [Armatimonadota bacterium]|nr:efflux RND transporter periplasmic adaptor subunit [Armatimonadota bacterium]
LDAAKAKVNQARGSLQTADASERQTIITAPTDGRVTLRNVEPGEMVTPGLPIVRVAQLRRVWIRVYVPEETIGRIKVGERASVTTDAFPQHRFTGKVIEVAQEPEFTPKNVQTKEERVKLVYGIKIEVENPDNLLKPGMPGDAVIFVK